MRRQDTCGERNGANSCGKDLTQQARSNSELRRLRSSFGCGAERTA